MGAVKGAAGARGAVGAKGARGAVALPTKKKIPAFVAAIESNIVSFDDFKFKGQLEEVNDLAQEIVELKRQQDALEDEAKGKRIQIQALMEDIDDSKSWSVKNEGQWTATYIAKGKPGRKLVPELLLKNGVPLAKIEKSYVPIEGKAAHVQIKGPSAKGKKAATGDDDE